MKRYALFLTVLFGLLWSIPGHAIVEVICFDKDFVRGTGEPVTESHTFPGINGPATVKLYNGGAEDTDTEIVSSSTVSVNGVEVFSPSNFNQNVSYLEATVMLNEGDNTLEVILKGKPGGYIRVKIVQDIEQIASEILNSQISGKHYYEELVSQNDSAAIEKTVDWLNMQPDVNSAAISEDGFSIWVQYVTGVEGLILTRSFESLSNPVSLNSFSYSEDSLKSETPSLSVETDKNAILLLPIDSIPNYKDESADDIRSFLEQSGYSVDEYSDQEVTLALMESVSQYDFIYMATHGALDFFGNIEIMTGEIANSNKIAGIWNRIKAGVTSGITIMSPPNTDEVYFALNKNFFDDYSYYNNFIYMNACSSLKNQTLANAFISNGTSVYMGWSDISFLALGSLHNPTFFQELAKYYNTIELAYNNTLANYYPATVFKDDNNNDNYHVRLLSGEDIGDINDTAINYALNIAYQGDSGYVLNTTVPGPNDIDDDGDTFTENQGDCHDSDPDIYPNAPEICDSKDNQCPGDPGYGEIDEGCQPPQPDYSVMTQNYYGTEYYIAVGIHSSTFDHAEVIAGPNIVSTWDNHAYLSQRPEVGDTYTIRLCYDELCNNYEEITYTVTSINDNFAWIFSPAQCQPINTSTPLIEWQQAPGVVTNYHMNIHNITNGGDDLIWGVRFSADTTSCTYNFNGTAQELLEAGRVYRIYLHAYDENINQATTVSTFYYQYLPAPTGLSATYDSNNNWNWITWQSVPCATYNLYWGTEPGVTKDSEFAGNTPNTEFSHTGVVPGWTYYYRVSSVNSAGESELSSEVSVYVPEVPLYITNPGFEDFVLSDGFFTIPPNGRSLPFGIFDNNPIPGWTITVVPGRGSFEVEAGTFNPNS
ncbi:MAG: putative metal-binding motif-containing protein, partial [Planctomycetota bacterium]